MNFREQAAIAALQALIIAETWVPPQSHDKRPCRPDRRVLATQAWNMAQALVDTHPDPDERTVEPPRRSPQYRDPTVDPNTFADPFKAK